MLSIWFITFTVFFIWLVRASVAYLHAIRSIHNFPGLRAFLNHGSVFSNYFLPPIPFISLGKNHAFRAKHSYFKQFGWDVISMVCLWPKVTTNLILADADAIKEVTSSRVRFPKPVWHYTVLSFFGRNIVASEGDEWKKYRKISSPAFSERNNKLVWDETVRIINDLFSNVWGVEDVVTVNHATELTLPIALFVIGAAGFGRRISWKDDTVKPENHAMHFKEAFHIVSSNVFTKLVMPRWAYLTEGLKRIDLAFNELQQYMSEMINDYQASSGDRSDLFSNLVEANNSEDDDKLSESELMGNIFIFLLAGHETTGNSLAFCLALLALHQEEQEILYKHIKSTITSDTSPTYADMPRLTYTMAVFYETLRMFPSVTTIPKFSAEDTTLVIGNGNGESMTIPIPKDAEIVIDTPGLHYNPRYWEDPLSFKPARFLEDWPRDAFLPFSRGPRACVGRKFAETEVVAVITMLVSKYKIEIQDEPQFSGESFEAKKTRILQTKAVLTLTPVRVPLVFKRRT